MNGGGHDGKRKRTKKERKKMESRAKFAGHARVTNHARRSSLYPAVTDMFVHMKDIRWKQNYLPKEMFVFKSPVCVLNVRTSTMINIKKNSENFY